MMTDNQAADAVTAGAGAVQNLFNRFAIGEMDWRSGRIDGQLPGEVSSELNA